MDKQTYEQGIAAGTIAYNEGRNLPYSDMIGGSFEYQEGYRDGWYDAADQAKRTNAKVLGKEIPLTKGDATTIDPAQLYQSIRKGKK